MQGVVEPEVAQPFHFIRLNRKLIQIPQFCPKVFPESSSQRSVCPGLVESSDRSGHHCHWLNTQVGVPARVFAAEGPESSGPLPVGGR
jgi:hypothetical protein